MPRAYPACSGCSLCRLVCPMWRQHRDPRFSPGGLAKALQCGAAAAELAPALDACSLCGACEPVCPENIALVDMILDLRRELAPDTAIVAAPMGTGSPPPGALLLPGAALRADPALLARVGDLLGLRSAADDGADISAALEMGTAVDAARRRSFLDGLDGRTLVIGDGLLLRWLRACLPGARLQGLGEELGSLRELRSRLTSTDFFVIEARAYHLDHERLVAHYDDLRKQTGCAINLDLQRMAIPATDDDAARWMLKGRRPARIVVENPTDREVLRRVSGLPVLHLAELAEARGSAHA